MGSKKPKSINYLKFIGMLFLLVAIITYLIIGNISGFCTDIMGYLKFTYKLLFLLGFLGVIPWNDIGLYIIDAKEFGPNKTYRQLVKKLRLRALLFKNISVLILFTSIVSIGYAVHNTVNTNVMEVKNLILNWDLTTIRIGAIFLLIFLIHVLFRVFRYIVRLAGFYDGIADALEIYLIKKENYDLSKLIDLLIPIKYDIRELKQSSISEHLKNLIKSNET